MNNNLLQWTNPRPLWWEAKGESGRVYVIQGVEGRLMYLITHDPKAPTTELRDQYRKHEGETAKLEFLQGVCENRERMLIELAKPIEPDWDAFMREVATIRIPDAFVKIYPPL